MLFDLRLAGPLSRPAGEECFADGGYLGAATVTRAGRSTRSAMR
jgi:hypothetical protein